MFRQMARYTLYTTKVYIKEYLHEFIRACIVKRPKNVILFIGDGMGISTVTLGRINKNQKAGNKYLNKPLYFETFSVSGLVKTSSFSQYVTDSAAGAMALLSGRKGVDRKIEFDSTAKKFGINCVDIAKQLLSYPASEFKTSGLSEVISLQYTQLYVSQTEDN
ncbi:hypothetical protein NECAME_13140 [Necator americanus]|uniref:alkaline phosphatase n=1 Tax=Necator americanus TaxID=51031 RepID=W2SZM8_NECAM|nr:hypothetical protein NECAME_13140 [Necator americanus]ETN74177.1 hypothetical protein NECAME_13140 [Necator americanus]